MGQISIEIDVKQQYVFDAPKSDLCDAKSRMNPDNAAMHNMFMPPTISSCTWSRALQQKTRDIFEQMPLTPDGNLHLKHRNLGFAYVPIESLCHSRLLIFTKPNDGHLWFDDADALVDAGWVID